MSNGSMNDGTMGDGTMNDGTMNDGREAELHAYIDGELDPDRRIAFEAFLANNPAAAARVHDYMHQRESLRLGLDLIAASMPDATTSLTERLRRRLGIDLSIQRFGPIAATILLLLGGWSIGVWLHEQKQRNVWAGVPAFADEAAEAHSTALALPDAQPGVSPPELEAMAGVLARRIGGMTVDLPAVDPNLTLVRASVVPWDDGPALQFVYREPDGEMLTLFVVVQAPVEDIGLHTVEQDGLQLVYWREGMVAYTVTGSKTDHDLLAVAKKMADSTRRS